MHRILTILTLTAVLAAGDARSQPAGPVKYTEVVDRPVRQTVELPGSVESRTTSVVASEAAGLVIELAARPGDVVESGTPLARLRDVFYQLQLEAARGRLAEASSRLELAESKLVRARELFDDKVISVDALDDAMSERTAWQGRVDATTAEIGQIELSIDRSTIRAPFTGVVTAKRTDVGQWIQLGGPVVEMVALQDLQVEVEVPERYYARLSPNTEAEVSFEALPGFVVTGRVDRIVPRADLASRSFPVKVRIPNDEGRIGVGMLARVAMPLGETYRALLVPKDSVIRQGPGEAVFRIRDDDTVEPVTVVSGQGVGSWIVVRGDVLAGQRVVTRGNERLRPGQAVRGQRLEYPLP